MDICDVSHNAIKHVLQHLKSTRHFQNLYKKTQTFKDKSSIESPKSVFCQYYSSKFVNYTLVLHSVGRHHYICRWSTIIGKQSMFLC